MEIRKVMGGSRRNLIGQHLMIAFRDRLQGYEDIEYASIIYNMPGNTFGRTGLTPEGTINEGEDENETWIVSVMSFDHNYLKMMQMDLSGGRNFNKDTIECPGILCSGITGLDYWTIHRGLPVQVSSTG